jgi:hypothetical protein
MGMREPYDYLSMMNTVLIILTIMIRFERASICAEDSIHHPITIEMQEDATVKDLVQCIMNYKEEGHDAIPNSGANIWWHLFYDKGTLARVCDNRRDCSYANVDSHTLLKDIPITLVYAQPAELPTNQPGGL